MSRVRSADTKMPSADRVPDGLQNFVFHQAIRVDPGRDFEHPLNGLTCEIARILDLRVDAVVVEPQIEAAQPDQLGLVLAFRGQPEAAIPYVEKLASAIYSGGAPCLANNGGPLAQAISLRRDVMRKVASLCCHSYGRIRVQFPSHRKYFQLGTFFALRS